MLNTIILYQNVSCVSGIDYLACMRKKSEIIKEKLIEMSRVCHNHKPQPTLDTKRKRKKGQKHAHAKQTNVRETQTTVSSINYLGWGLGRGKIRLFSDFRLYKVDV